MKSEDKMEYTLEFLEKKFAEHAIEAKKLNEVIVKTFKENNPDEPLPIHMTSDFSLCAALACICNEILKLKKVK